MAKLIRAKRQAQTKPVGIVQMSGLRDMGNAMGQVAQLGDQGIRTFGELAKNQAIEETQLEFAEFSRKPSQERQRIIQQQNDEIAKGNGEVVYQENSLGKPQPLVPDQIPTRDTGIWSGVKAQTWNKMASEWNAMKAGSQINRFASTKISEQLASGNFNPTKFEQELTAYSDAVIANTDMRAAPATRILLDKTLNDGFNQLTAKALAKDELIWQQQHKVVADEFQSIIANTIREKGVYDSGLPMIAQGAWYHEMRKLEKAGIPQTEYATRFQKFAKDFHIAGITYVLNQKFGQAKTATEVDAIAERTLQDIAKAKTDAMDIPTLQLDVNTGQVSLVKAPFSNLYKTPAELEETTKAWMDIVKTNMTLKTQIKDLQLAAMETSFIGELNNAMIAAEKGNFGEAERLETALFKRFERIDSPDYNKLIQSGLRWMLKAQDFRQGKVSEQLAQVYATESDAIIDRLKSYLNESQLDEYQTLYGPVTEKNFQNLRDGMNPTTIAAANKAKIVKLLEILNRKDAGSKGWVEFTDATMGRGERLPVTETNKKQAQTFVNLKADQLGYIPEGEVYVPFQHNPENNTTEVNISTDLVRGISSSGQIPNVFVNRARAILQNIDGPPSQKQAVLKFYRTLKQENLYSRAELKSNFTEELFDALEYGYTQVEDMDVSMLSANVTTDMALFLRGEKELPKPKISTTIAANKDAIQKIGSRWFSSDTPVLSNHANYIANLAIKYQANDQSLDDESAFDMAVDQFQKKYKVSNWGIRGANTWVRDPIERKYPNLVEINGSDVKTGNLKTLIRRQLSESGDIKIGLDTSVNVDDLTFPDDPLNQGKGYQVHFMKPHDNATYYNAYVKVFDPANPDAPIQPVPVTNEFGLVQIDLSKENAYEGKRKEALGYIKTMQKQRQAIADGALAKVATFAEQNDLTTGIVDPAVWSNVVSSVEAQQDVRDLQELWNKIDKQALNFDPEILKMYQSAPLRMRVKDVINLTQAMEKEEADNFKDLPVERQIEILKDYDLDLIRPQLERYFNLNLYTPDSIMGTDYTETMEPR